MSTSTRLRIWPGVVIVTAQWVISYLLPWVAPDAEIAGYPLGFLAVIGGVVFGLLVVLWWLLFSRAPLIERVGVLLLLGGALAVTRLFVHESIAGAGMGMLLYIAAIPGLSLALVAWAAIAHRLPPGARQAAIVAAVLLACLPWTLIRTAGIVGGGGSEYYWRWTPTPEEELLAQAHDELLVAPAPAAADAPPPVSATTSAAADKLPDTTAVLVPQRAEAGPSALHDAASVPRPAASGSAPAEWPGFRGAARDGVIRGLRVATDWTASPPTEIWRRRVGPGWSSFAVKGDLLYTQEQRGDEEIVASYRVSTGEPVWRHRDNVRFWESNGGAGPRATPTVHGNRVFAFGATGVLNALDAATGTPLWSRNVAADTGRRVPDWGFASSPLVVDDLVIVAAAGTLAAYDLATGAPRWRGPNYGGSYSSPHRATIDGVDQIVLLGGPGAISVAPEDGAVLWEHKWAPGTIVQPAITEDGDIVVNALAATGGMGTRRLHPRRGEGEWILEERWTSNGLKPYFNDFVIHKAHAYGFDGSILAALDLSDGTRKWKGGRYGNGQLVLLADQDLLLVLSEDGELALVRATPDGYAEVARHRVLDGKTWNHPVLVGNLLLVRNGEEMAAFRLPLAER